MERMEISTWGTFKSIVASKGLSLQYVENQNSYDIFAGEASMFMWHIIVVKGGAEAADFEANYMGVANAPVTLKVTIT